MVLFEIVMRMHERDVVASGDHGVMVDDIDNVLRNEGETEASLSTVVIFPGNLTHVILAQGGGALSSLEDQPIAFIVVRGPRVYYAPVQRP